MEVDHGHGHVTVLVEEQIKTEVLYNLQILLIFEHMEDGQMERMLKLV